jgi:alkaline phosphatase D
MFTGRSLAGAILLACLLAACSAPDGGESGASTAPDVVGLSSKSLASDTSISRLAFGSCFKQSRGGHSVWEAVLRTEPQLFLYAGDTLYPEKENTDPAQPFLRQAYADLAAVGAFAALRREVPVWPVWDDHDYGMNDGGADFSARALSEALFEDAWGLDADDPRRSRDGVYHARVLGAAPQRLQLIVLDTRFFRSPLRPTDERGAPGRERYLPDADPQKTLLGAEQWRWLQEQLEEPAELRVIVSSIQVLADGHGWESWRLFPRERERLFTLLREHDAVPTLLLSGDRHVAGFYRLDIGARAPLLEFTSSALNNTIPFPYRRATLAEAGPNRLGDLFGEANFGTLDIDWNSAQVALLLQDAAGAVVRRVDWRFDGATGEAAGR